MRIALTEKDFLESLESARSEAQKAFGNTDMIVEKYVQRPRHVEVQVIHEFKKFDKFRIPRSLETRTEIMCTFGNGIAVFK